MSGDGDRHVPPREPGHEHAPRRPPSFWRKYGLRSPVGVLLIAAVVFLGLAALVVTVLPRYDGVNRIPQCRRNLMILCGILTSERLEYGWPDQGGVQLLLEWRKNGFIAPGREHLFICSLDSAASTLPAPTGQAREYETVAASDRDALVPLFSYAVRDFARFPVNADNTDPESGKLAWVMCDRQGPDGRTQHHPNGLHVAFADGSVRFMAKGLLGFAPEERVVVGPESSHPELRKMVFFAEPTEIAPQESER
jgi:prepilin-type processing-associated H-X9-DG protein